MPTPTRRVRIVFAGNERDQHGMPVPYYSYLLLAGDWEGPEAGIASIVPFGDDPPPSFEMHHVTRTGGAQAALDQAERHLDLIHPGLRRVERAGPPPTRELLACWLLTVIPRLLQGLTQELHFLRERNPTWRYRAQRCEQLGRLPEHMGHQQGPLLDQFRRQYLLLSDSAEQHDLTLARLERAAQQLHSTLVGQGSFLDIVREIEAEFPDWRGAVPVSDGPALLAEYAVNYTRITELRWNTSAEAWAKYRQRVLDVSSTVAKPESDQIQTSIDELLVVCSSLKDSLVVLRERLSEEFSVTPVPFKPFDPYEETV